MAKKYHAIWNTEDCCDGIVFDTLDEATGACMEILEGWIESFLCDNVFEYDMFGLPMMDDDVAEEWNNMIDNCYVYVAINREDADEYELKLFEDGEDYADVWYPTDKDEASIGWDYYTCDEW